MGVVQALVSIFAEDDDKLRSVVKGRTRIAFLIKPEMYLFAVSDWGEPEHVLRMQLEYINLQILSVVSASQLARVFARRANFDLSRLLVGSEKFLNKLVETCQEDMSFMTTTLQPLRMPPALRDTAAAALMPPAKFKVSPSLEQELTPGLVVRSPYRWRSDRHAPPASKTCGTSLR